MKAKQLLTAALFMAAAAANAQYLSVNDPRKGGWGTGIIESLSVDVEPGTSTAKYVAEAVFGTAPQTNAAFLATDSLELQGNFTLPSGASITKAELLIDGVWTEAQLLPRSQATQVYENIVQRVRRDPLLISCYGNNSYSINIFPFYAKDSRSIRLTVAAPLNGNGLVEIPFAEFKGTQAPKKTSIRIAENKSIGTPSIAGKEMSLVDGKWTAQLDSAGIAQSSAISTDFRADNLRFEASKSNGQVAYTLSFNAQDQFDLKDPRKFMFLIDNDEMPYAHTYSSYEYINDTARYTSKTTLVKAFKTEDIIAKVLTAAATLGKGDLFNVVVKTDGVLSASKGWLPATPEGIALAKKALENADSYKSGLDDLLASADSLAKISNAYTVLISNTHDMMGSDWQAISTAAQATAKKHGINERWKIMSTIYPRSINAGDYYYYYLYSSYLNQLKNNTRGWYGDDVYEIENIGYNFTSFKTAKIKKYAQPTVSILPKNAALLDRSLPYLNGSSALGSQYAESGVTEMTDSITVVISQRVNGKLMVKKASFGVQEYAAGVAEQANTELANRLWNTGDAGLQKEALVVSMENKLLTNATSYLALENGQKIDPCMDCVDPWEHWSRWWPMIDAPIFFDGGMRTTTMLESSMEKTGNTATGSTGEVVSSGQNAQAAYNEGLSKGQNDCKASADDSYKLGFAAGKAAGVTSIGGQDKAGISVFPTIFDQELTISFEGKKISGITISDLASKTLFTLVSESDSSIVLDSSVKEFVALEQGMYILTVIAKDGSAESFKIAKK